jgi:hypothetical protein
MPPHAEVAYPLVRVQESIDATRFLLIDFFVDLESQRNAVPLSFELGMVRRIRGCEEKPKILTSLQNPDIPGRKDMNIAARLHFLHEANA